MPGSFSSQSVHFVGFVYFVVTSNCVVQLRDSSGDGSTMLVASLRDVLATFSPCALHGKPAWLIYVMSPLTASRRDGKIVLEIDERQFLADALESHEDLRLVDREQFIRFALANIYTLTHDVDHDDLRVSWWKRLTESIGKAAAATSHGVRKDTIATPTCGCDPEEHDGG
jgi:hypothetical protein